MPHCEMRVGLRYARCAGGRYDVARKHTYLSCSCYNMQIANGDGCCRAVAVNFVGEYS